jgi:hypothetical protein
MPQCTFSINFTGSASDLITKVETAIDNAGGSFTGDTSSGSYSVPTPLGQIKGTYTMNNASPINIVITQKPFLVSCNDIETKLNEYINS